MYKETSLPKWAQDELKRLRRQIQSLENQLDRPSHRKGDDFYVVTGRDAKFGELGYKLDPELHEVHLKGFEFRFKNDTVEIRECRHGEGDLAVRPICSNVIQLTRVK